MAIGLALILEPAPAERPFPGDLLHDRLSLHTGTFTDRTRSCHLHGLPCVERKVSWDDEIETYECPGTIARREDGDWRLRADEELEECE